MKYAGKQIEGPNVEMVFIPRTDGDLVFKCKAVLDQDYESFETLCPDPQPPEVIRPGNIRTPNVADPEYGKQIDEWANKRTAFMILASLSATDELEWDTVAMEDPDTWANYKTELQSSGFTAAEIMRIVSGVMSACGMNDDKIDEARERFLAAQLVAQQSE